jgi:hypothetical protein
VSGHANGSSDGPTQWSGDANAHGSYDNGNGLKVDGGANAKANGSSDGPTQWSGDGNANASYDNGNGVSGGAKLSGGVDNGSWFGTGSAHADGSSWFGNASSKGDVHADGQGISSGSATGAIGNQQLGVGVQGSASQERGQEAKVSVLPSFADKE